MAAMSFVALSASAQSVEGTSYMLPKNGLRFTIKVEKSNTHQATSASTPSDS